MDQRFSRYSRWLAPAAFLLWAGVLHAAEVTAQLDREIVGTDEPVVLSVTISDGHLDEKIVPPKIPGLQYIGSSYHQATQIDLNTGFKRTVTASFQYAAETVGVVSIPAISVKVDGKTVRTTPLSLNVEAGSGGSRNAGSSWQGRPRHPARSQAPSNPFAQVPSHAPDQEEESEPQKNERVAFAEWVLPKKSGYVGEAIPAELRLYVANRLRWDLNQFPTITGDGFMMQKLSNKPSSSVVTKEGQQWDMLVFKTAITPVKSGQITLEPSEFLPTVVFPQKVRRTAPPGFRDFFDDPFFNDAFGVSVRKQISVKTESLELEVKPLPEEGKPESFAGAVGRFTLDVSAQPLRVKGGDPVTMTMKIGGTGNFERVTAPPVSDSEGWQSYPPSSKFEGDDEVGISGDKIFEMAIVPNGADGVDKRDLPEVEFSYFDPVQEQYVVLHGDRKEIVVSGGDKAPEPPAKSSIANHAPEEKKAETKPDDIRFIRLDPGMWYIAQGPVWKSPFFVGIQGVALLAFVGWCSLNWRKARPAPSRETLWKSERAAALKRARQAGNVQEFYDAAVETLTLHAAISGAGDRETVSVARIVEVLQKQGAPAEVVEEIFATRDRLRYAGSGALASGDERMGLLQQELAKIVKA